MRARTRSGAVPGASRHDLRARRLRLRAPPTAGSHNTPEQARLPHARRTIVAAGARAAQLRHWGEAGPCARGAQGPELFSNEAVRGGSAWGAGTFANSDGSRQPSELELNVAKFQAGPAHRRPRTFSRACGLHTCSQLGPGLQTTVPSAPRAHGCPTSQGRVGDNLDVNALVVSRSACRQETGLCTHAQGAEFAKICLKLAAK